MKEGQLVELVGEQSPSPETPPRRGAVEKSWRVKVFAKRSEEMTQSNTSLHGSPKYLSSPR